MGVLNAADVQTVTSTGVYRVATAEVTGGVPRVLRVTRPTGKYYYLEFRQPYGRYDNFASGAAVVNGVSIRIAPGVGSLAFSKLIDTNPQTNTFGDAALGVGRGFADTINDIFVVTQAIDPTGATVLVHVGPDTVLPTAPGSLQATSDAAGAITLRWTPSTDDVLVTGYQVGRDGAVIGTVDGTSFADAGLPQGRTYGYSVSALDLAGNVGAPTPVTIYLPDTTPPGSAGPLTATPAGPHAVTLGWVAAADNVAVSSYQVRRNGTVIGTTAGTTFVDATAPDGIALTYQARALDAAGNAGPSASAGITLPDVTGPTLGGALGLTFASDGTINVSWPAATDNVAVSGYEVSRDGAPVATTPNASYADAGLAQARTYQYSVTASDAATNSSGPLTGSIYLPDVTAPSSPGTLTVVQSGPRAVDLRWGSATDNTTIDHYVVSIDGSPTATVFDIRLLALAVEDGVNHHFSVAALDAAGNVGPSVGTDLALPDVTVPSVAGSFSARATGATSVALAWAAATDNVGVDAYRLSRDGVPLVELGGSARSYTEAGLASSRSYTYTLTAVDAAGNQGGAVVAQVTLTAVDSIAPSVPLDLRAVALTRRRISLSWAPSTDNQPGSLSYRVFRGRKRIATVTTLSYVDRPAVSGWYKYRVKAVDAAGNVSSFSVAVWVKAHA
jgi:fibronectin type 3 domain-containing protein